ncbi:MAG: hypothetical protein ACJART_002591 [Maribacter sp.]|jgi:hypothetical protein
MVVSGTQCSVPTSTKATVVQHTESSVKINDYPLFISTSQLHTR